MTTKNAPTKEKEETRKSGTPHETMHAAHKAHTLVQIIHARLASERPWMAPPVMPGHAEPPGIFGSFPGGQPWTGATHVTGIPEQTGPYTTFPGAQPLSAAWNMPTAMNRLTGAEPTGTAPAFHYPFAGFWPY